MKNKAKANQATNEQHTPNSVSERRVTAELSGTSESKIINTIRKTASIRVQRAQVYKWAVASTCIYIYLYLAILVYISTCMYTFICMYDG